MDLFGVEKTFDDLLIDLKKLAEEVTVAYELPERGVIVLANIGKGKNNKGQVISYSVCTNEPPYPATEDEMKDENRTQTRLITIQAPKAKKSKDAVMFTIDNFMTQVLPPTEDMELLTKNKTDEEMCKQRIRVAMTSPSLLPWMKSFIEYRIKNFYSAADSFGCCSLFNECSNAKKCIHPNRLYSTVCAYRRNLESGRIFYGKNQNV